MTISAVNTDARVARAESHATWLALCAIVGTVAAAILIVNPQRELLTWDDGWAYARSVLHLLNRGSYALDQWSAANMPVQIGFAAGLSCMFGYSLTLLRWTTLTLLILLLVSFFWILRTFRCRLSDTSALTLGLLASPVLFSLSFTFMSDVQFLAWLIFALCLYDRGLRQRSRRFLAAGAIAATCAIGTRQFGIAIFGGWAIVALLARPLDRPSKFDWLAALLLPSVMAIWQLTSGATSANFTQAYRLAEQRVLMHQPPLQLLIEGLWRSAICLQYLAGYMLPVIPLTVGMCVNRWRTRPEHRMYAIGLTITTLGFVAAGLHLNSPLTVRPPMVGHMPWPALGMIWVLPSQPWASDFVKRALDAIAFLSITPLAWLVVSGPLPNLRTRSVGVTSLLLTGTAFTLLVLFGSYVQFNDTYVVALVPFALLAIGNELRREPIGLTWTVASGVWAMTFIGALSISLHDQYDDQQVLWDKAERLSLRGVPAAQISGPKHWAEYHGAFDDWIHAGAPGLKPPPSRLVIGSDPLHDPFYGWLAERNHIIIAKESAALPSR